MKIVVPFSRPGQGHSAWSCSWNALMAISVFVMTKWEHPDEPMVSNSFGELLSVRLQGFFSASPERIKCSFPKYSKIKW